MQYMPRKKKANRLMRHAYVSAFSRKSPHKIVLQPHYMRKMELTFPMAALARPIAPP